MDEGEKKSTFNHKSDPYEISRCPQEAQKMLY
jgi:hypothetical protein